MNLSDIFLDIRNIDYTHYNITIKVPTFDKKVPTFAFDIIFLSF